MMYNTHEAVTRNAMSRDILQLRLLTRVTISAWFLRGGMNWTLKCEKPG